MSLTGRVGRSIRLARERRRRLALERAGEDALRAAQDRAVRQTVEFAYRVIPHYRRVLDELGIAPSRIRTAADLALLPLLDREVVQRRGRELRPAREGGLLRLRSTGTTGAPRSVFHDPPGLVRAGALNVRAQRELGRLLGDRPPRSAVELVPPASSVERLDAFFAAATVGIYRPERCFASLLDPVEAHAALVEEVRPELLRGYGSALGALLSHRHRTGRPAHLPRAVVYTADELPPGVRTLAIEELGLAVLTTYQAVEALVLGFDCRFGRGIHVNSDLYALRVVDANGATQPAGTPGEVVISNLVNRGTVLLNYRLGDVAYLVPERCPCGRVLPLLSYPQGRTRDWVARADGERRHAMTVHHAFRELPGVLEYEVVQEEVDRFTARVVAERGDREALVGAIRDQFRARLGPATRVEVRFCDALPRPGGGKATPFRSLAWRGPAVGSDAAGPPAGATGEER